MGSCVQTHSGGSTNLGKSSLEILVAQHAVEGAGIYVLVTHLTSFDLITSLPESEGNTAVLTVVDSFSKSVH